MEPTPEQVRIRDHWPLDLLGVAPAGWGKTEALALRVAGLLARGAVRSPQRVLVTTFSNRARDNIRDRLRSHLAPSAIRARVTVANFHGLSARIFRAHANVIGMDPEMILPESDWVGEQCRQQNLGFRLGADVQQDLRVVKEEARTDDEVEQVLQTRGAHKALAIERQRR